MLTPEEKKAAYARRNQHHNYQSPERGKKIGEKLAKRWQNPEFRARMCEIARTCNNPRTSVPVTVDGVNYPSIKAAAQATGRPYASLQRFSAKARDAAKEQQ